MEKISIVVPVYQCAPCLRELHRRVCLALKNITMDYELILVDDHAKDGAWEIISQLSNEDESVVGVRLSRNFGQHAAITAGLKVSKGDWVVVMDCDLQDPPEKIPELYQAAKNGYDVVLTCRKIKKHSYLRRSFSNLYFKFMRIFSGNKIDPQCGSFSIISRKVVDAYLLFKDQQRHYLFILYWLGFRTHFIEYEHAERHSGKSSYSLRKLIEHAFEGMLFQTTILLKWVVYLGFAISTSGLFYTFYLIYRYYKYSAYPGWTSLAVILLLLGGFIITTIGIVGIYVAKVFEQVKNRPLYVIDHISKTG